MKTVSTLKESWSLHLQLINGLNPEDIAIFGPFCPSPQPLFWFSPCPTLHSVTTVALRATHTTHANHTIHPTHATHATNKQTIREIFKDKSDVLMLKLRVVVQKE